MTYSDALHETLYSLTEYEVPTPVEIFNSRLEDNSILILSYFNRAGKLKVQFLNKTALFIFLLCDGKNTLGEITLQMQAQFRDISPTKILKDCLGTIRNLENRELIQISRER